MLFVMVVVNCSFCVNVVIGDGFLNVSDSFLMLWGLFGGVGFFRLDC